MKTKMLFIAVLYICTTSLLIAQNGDPRQKKLMYNGIDSIMFSSTLPVFQRPDQTILGFHWGNHASISRAIFANQNNVYAQGLIKDGNINFTSVQNNANLMVEGVVGSWEEGVWSHCYGGKGILNARSMQFEPTLLVNHLDSQKVIISKRSYDTTHPIFGFEYVNPVAVRSTNPEDINYNSLQILNTTALRNQVIFSNPWNSNLLCRNEPSIYSSYEDKPSWSDYYGYSLNISINLKRYDLSNVPGDTVLEITMPYVTNIDSLTIRYIKFDSIATTNRIKIISTLQDTLGYATNAQFAAAYTTSFVITKNMLPPDCSPVTISTHFECFGVLDSDRYCSSNAGYRNPRICYMFNTGDLPSIKKLGITAKYKGGCPICIDWVRLETPHSQQLYRGKYDSTICNWLQNDINAVNTFNSTVSNNAKIFRFTDITEYGVSHFGAARYINKLLGDVFVGATFPYYPILYEYYVNPPERFIEIWGVRTNINAPYCEKGILEDGLRYKSYGLITGYTKKYMNDPLTLSEQLNSVWETYPPHWKNNRSEYNEFSDFYPLVDSNIWKLKWVPGSTSPTNSFQSIYDHDLWYNFVNEPISGFHWSKKPWWIYTNNCLEWYTKVLHPSIEEFAQLDPSKQPSPLPDTILTTYFNDSGRPNTAEETRVSKMLMILMGCRGLLYDGLSYDYGNFSRQAKDSGMVHYPLDRNADESTFYNYVMNDSLGGDYIGLESDCKRGSMLCKDYFFNNYANLLYPQFRDDTCQKYLGVNSNKLYIGRKSIRSELYKIHRWIRAIDSVMAKSHLVAWHGKGYLRLHQQCPDSTDGDIMSKFLVVDSTRTKRLWVPDPNDFLNGGSNVATYEDSTNQFYDITLLRKDSISMKTNYLLGVSNRRTDPLIFDKYGDDTQYTIKFKSAAEFDNLCFGPDALHYREMYWKRHGAREIDIKLDNPTDYDDTEVSFRITELGKDSKLLKNEFWFNPPFNHVIDTNLLVGQHLKLRMLPGQGKLLNVEVLIPNNVVAGDLDYSNQTKLVAFSCDSNYSAHDTFDIGKVRYHMVYGRRRSQEPGPYCNVYYKRSIPMDRLTKDIVWEPEHQLNDSVFIYDCSQVPDTVYSLKSNYPSLVVRCDTINNAPTPMVYVVYQATGGGCIDTTKIRIIENVFPANTATIITMARQIADVESGTQILPSGSRFGIPVINASSNGNYYAWNDSLLGIVAGFKYPGQRGWIPSNQRNAFKIFSTDIYHEPHAYHPSLNTYSTISADEMDCSLVWEESWSGIYRDQFNQIFYTRLKYCPESGLTHYVHKKWSVNNNWYKKAIYNTDSTIVGINDPSPFFRYLHLPTVYRDVEYYDASNPPVYNGMWPNLAKTDRVYYQGRVSYLDFQQGIFMKFISSADSFNLSGCPKTLPMNWMVEGPSMILSANKDLAHPNVAQGKLVKKYCFPSGNVYYSGDSYVNDSSLVINFVEYPYVPDLLAEVPRTADIWQINHGYFSLLYGPFYYDYGLQFPYNTPKAHKIGSKGKYSHLARLPYINNDKTWEYGHRIFESYSDPFGEVPQIKSYDYLLYKKTYDAEANYLFYGFKDTLGNRSVFSPIYLTIDGREHAIVPKFDEKNKIYSDTLFSNWFKIDNYQDIDMLHFGNNKKCLYLKLQRKDDKKLFSVQTDKSSERFDYTKHNIHLVNGKSKEYRFAWIKTTKSDFTEMTILGLPPMNEMTKDELLGKVSINIDENYLDLSEDMTSEIPEGSSLYIYPNPANEKVMIYYEQERKSNINISIYGMLGTTIKSVFTGDIDKGKYQYSVNTKDIPAGIYFVRVEGNNKTIVKKLVIE